jgi:hypothetical protein
MRRFTTTVDIAASPARVWAVMSDTARWHEWTPSITRITRLGDGPFAVGTRELVRQPKFPPALWTVRAVDAGRGFTWDSVGPGFRAIGHHYVEPAPAGSRVTLTLELTGPLGGLWGRMTRGITERYIAMEAAGLKARSEAPAGGR